MSDLVHAVLSDAFSRIGESVRRTLDGLDEEQLVYRPSSDANSIAWLIWHLTRAQDAQIADMAGNDQVWLADGWQQKFGLALDQDSTGYGHDSRQVAAVRADAGLLQGYYDATQTRTLAFLDSLKPEDYDRVIDTAWTPPVTVAVRLVSILDDDMQHAGQAGYIRGLVLARDKSAD